MFALKNFATVSRNVQKSFRLAHTLPDLPYASNALEPIISSEIMELHHQKHHAAYINNYNNAEKQLKEALNNNQTEKALSLLQALKFNGGGHINHSIFWCNLSPCGGEPTGDLKETICKSFGSVDEMKNRLMNASNAIQGSGWGWVGYNKLHGCLQIATTANQDTLEATHGLIPIFGIDVWEHAYYLQYKNVRPEYTKKIMEIINWKDLSERLAKAKC